MKPKIAIEIGTSYTKIYKSHCDVVLYEPTLIAISKNNYKKPIAVGFDAEKLFGKVNENVKIIRPVNNSEITNYKAICALLISFINKIKQKGERGFDVLLTVQCGWDRAVISKFENALFRARLYNVSFVESPILALLGADVPISDNSCHAIIDIGGGQTTVCVLNLNGVISGVSAGIGGNTLNEMIRKHAEENLNLTLPNYEIETLKRTVASLIPHDETKTLVQGRQTSTAKPITTNVSAKEISAPVLEYVRKTANIINLVLDKLNGDCLAELAKNGVYLTGGGSGLYGLENYFTNLLGFTTKIVPEPKISSILGAGKLLNDKTLYNKLKLKS